MAWWLQWRFDSSTYPQARAQAGEETQRRRRRRGRGAGAETCGRRRIGTGADAGADAGALWTRSKGSQVVILVSQGFFNTCLYINV